jgi:hypothetical protein
MSSTTVIQIIAIHRGQHDVVETPSRDSLCRIFGLGRVERAWLSVGFHGAEAAAARAFVAHEHDGCRGYLCFAASPTVAD